MCDNLKCASKLFEEFKTCENAPINGKLIVIEGLDASGKTTQCKKLCKYLNTYGEKAILTKEPTNGKIGQFIREFLSKNEEVDMSFQASLFLADRIDHNINPINGINTMLKNEKFVISDRYYYSSFAYQSTKCDLKWLLSINLMCKAIRKPDLCFIIDIDPYICHDRINKTRDNVELYEKNIDEMKKIRNNFLSIATFLKTKYNENIVIINGEFNEEEVFEQIITHPFLVQNFSNLN